ncbi:MAG: M20/M25/M40 family metallo-hydrolase [Pseudomonadota bacterium]
MSETTVGDRTKRIESILLELVGIPSITGTSGEERIARFIHDRIKGFPYFRNHSDKVRLFSSSLPDIPVPLFGVFALVRAAMPTRKTVLLIAHFDVVDVKCYGSLKSMAFDPMALARAMGGMDLPLKAKEDLESGNYLFGRGIMDMKLGLALEMELLEEFSRDTDLYDVNVALLAVGDEENNNGGMRVGAMCLQQVCTEFDLDLDCVVNTEPSDAGRPGTREQMIFLGTIGKLLPFFYILGAGAHAGSYYQGISASLLGSFLHTLIEANPALADSDQGEITAPPLGLGFELRHREYSVTLPDRVATYFNYCYLKKTPSVILGEMRAMAQEAVARTLDHVGRSYAVMKSLGYGGPDNDLAIPVVTYKELYARVRSDFGQDLDTVLEQCARDLPGDLDAREKGICVVEKLLDQGRQDTPVIVIGLLPPFLPSRTSLGTSPKELALRKAVEKLQSYCEGIHDTRLEKTVYFAGISDMSYVGCDVDPGELAMVSGNIPGWGQIYAIPFEAVQALDAPVANLGPMGRDAHKMTERLEKDYAFRILPDLMRFFIRQF